MKKTMMALIFFTSVMQGQQTVDVNVYNIECCRCHKKLHIQEYVLEYDFPLCEECAKLFEERYAKLLSDFLECN